MATVTATAGTPFTHNGSTVGTPANVDWTNTADCLTANSTPADVAVRSSTAPISYGLCVPYTATVPGTITGVTVTVRRRATPGIGAVRCIFAALVGGSDNATVADISGEDKETGAGSNVAAGTFANTVYGSGTDLWALPSATILARVTAGTLCFAQQYQAGGDTDNAQVDDVSVVITYTPFDVGIPGQVADWDAVLSQPVINLSLGSIGSLGNDLSGAGATFAVRNTPRWNNNQFGSGVLCLPSADINTARTGFEITLPAPPAGAWFHRKFMVAMVITPLNMIGDASGVGRTFSTDNGASFPGLHKNWMNGSGGTLADGGYLTVNGATGTRLTAVKDGIERQVVCFYSTSSGAWGFCNNLASKNVLTANGDTGTFTKLFMGFLDPAIGITNNPFIGVIHAVKVWALDNTTGAGVQFTDQNAVDAMAALATQWAVQTTKTKMVSICGDSIGYADGRLYENVVNTGSLALNTQLNFGAGYAAGTTSIVVDSTAGFASTRIVLDPGTPTAEVVTISAIPDGTHLTISATRNAHADNAIVCNAYYGFNSPYADWPTMSKKIGSGAAVKLFNLSTPAALASNATANPPADGSMTVYGAAATITGIFQRGSNDIAAGATAATVLGYAETYATNAKGQASPANKVIVCDVIDRFDFTAGQRTASQTYNASLRANALGKFDAVCKFTDHPWLTQPSNPATITVSGATAATAFSGIIFDNLGVHPRHFGNACMAIMADKSYADAHGESVGYAPLPLSISFTGTTISWSAPPSSPNAPTMAGNAGDGPSALCIIIRRNGAQIAKIAPLTIDTTTGAATYATSYNTGFTKGVFTVEVADAAGNVSGEVGLTIGGGGTWRERAFRERTFVR